MVRLGVLLPQGFKSGFRVFCDDILKLTSLTAPLYIVHLFQFAGNPRDNGISIAFCGLLGLTLYTVPRAGAVRKPICDSVARLLGDLTVH